MSLCIFLLIPQELLRDVVSEWVQFVAGTRALASRAVFAITKMTNNRLRLVRLP
jgi:hypothetical protein